MATIGSVTYHLMSVSSKTFMTNSSGMPQSSSMTLHPNVIPTAAFFETMEPQNAWEALHSTEVTYLITTTRYFKPPTTTLSGICRTRWCTSGWVPLPAETNRIGSLRASTMLSQCISRFDSSSEHPITSPRHSICFLQSTTPTPWLN